MGRLFRRIESGVAAGTLESFYLFGVFESFAFGEITNKLPCCAFAKELRHAEAAKGRKER